MGKMDNEWLNELAGMVRQVGADIVEMAGSGQYPVVVLLRGYDLLECLSDVEKVKYHMQQDKEAAEALKAAMMEYGQGYLSYGEQMNGVIDMEQVKMKAAAYMGPWKKRHNDALEEVARLEKLLEAAKAAHKAQEEGGFLEKWRTLRAVREMAGFRLERKRTGNFVARCEDDLHMARTEARKAELNVYAHSVEHKCSPETYLRIFELINDKYLV